MADYLLTSYTTAIRKEGGWISQGADGGDSAFLANWPACALRFKGTATSGTISIRHYNPSATANVVSLHVKVGGVWLLVGKTSTASQNAWATLSLSASGYTSGENEWLIGFGASVYITKITIDSLNTAALTPRVTFAGYGDSIIAAIQGTLNDACAGDVFLSAIALDLACENRGIGGTTVRNVSGSDNSAGESRTADITGISPAPAKVLIRYGLNDMGQVKGAETASQLETSYTAMLTTLTSTLTTTNFYCESIIKVGSQGSRTMWDAAISNSVAAVNTLRGNSNCVFIPIDGWTEYTAQTSAPAQTTDGTHSNTLGYSLLYNREIPIVSTMGYSVSLSAPSGPVGTPITVTYTRTNGSTWVTGETVATTDSSSGTFGTFTFISGQTTATRTYTPASRGAKTLTHTNSQIWGNPSTSGFTASDADSSSSSSASSLSSASSASSNSSSSPSSQSSPSSASSNSSSSSSTASSASSVSSDSSSSRSSQSSASTASSPSSVSSPSSSSSSTGEVEGPSLDQNPARNDYPSLLINDADPGVLKNSTKCSSYICIP